MLSSATSGFSHKAASMCRGFNGSCLLIVKTPFMLRSAPARPQPFAFDEDELKDEAGRRTRH